MLLSDKNKTSRNSLEIVKITLKTMKIVTIF